jgi:hypothetical protein
MRILNLQEINPENISKSLNMLDNNYGHGCDCNFFGLDRSAV